MEYLIDLKLTHVTYKKVLKKGHRKLLVNYKILVTRSKYRLYINSYL